MDMQSFFKQIFHSPLPRRAAVVLMLVAMFIGVLPSRLAANSRDKIDKLARECQSGKQKACDDLGKIAAEGRNWSVRIAAVRMLTDQDLLAKIALENATVKDRRRGDTRQAAVWIVTDNANYAALGTLVVHALGVVYGGTRVINEAETARAMKICDNAGIDITRKAIWNDRQRVIDGLKDADLKKWLVEAGPVSRHE